MLGQAIRLPDISGGIKISEAQGNAFRAVPAGEPASRHWPSSEGTTIPWALGRLGSGVTRGKPVTKLVTLLSRRQPPAFFFLSFF